MNEIQIILLGLVLVTFTAMYFMGERHRRDIVCQMAKFSAWEPDKIQLRVYKPDENGVYRIDAYVPKPSSQGHGMEWRTIVQCDELSYLNDSMIELVQSGDFTVADEFPKHRLFKNN